jgi:eukaryotic translation initiation factor 2C
MIKFTVTKPTVRQNNIGTNIGQLDWASDPLLRAYDMKVDRNMLKTQARILPTPKVEYGKGSQDYQFTPQGGRWDLRGKKFFTWGPNDPGKAGAGIKAWAVMVFGSPGRVPEASVKNFFRELVKSIGMHGGLVVQKDIPVMYADPSKAVGTNIFELYKKAGNITNSKPQILFFVLMQRATQPYNDIKAYCDTMIGVVSQCLQFRHVEQAKAQYCSNVCMKINAKLGGSTNCLAGSDHPFFKKEATMYLGADVSHASPGNPNGSYASMVGSVDNPGIRFAAVAGTNGERTELISADNVVLFVKTLLRAYRTCTSRIPANIIYFRDGVSEGQYEQIIRVELEAIKQACRSLSATFNPKFTVVICSKRHHFRFFPADKQGSDRNGNPVPGTIVDKDITHPKHYDFYLNSHNAIQGTSRPVHYQVIWDENKFPVDQLQALIYNMCYMYIRATCSVSLVPATYYAHVASARARCHEPDTEDHLSTTHSSRSRPPTEGLKRVHVDLASKMWFI